MISVDEMEREMDAACERIARDLNERMFFGKVFTPRERIEIRLANFRVDSGYAAWRERLAS